MRDKVKEIIEQSKEQLSIKQISDMTGISRSSVKRYCLQLNYVPKRHEVWNKNLTKDNNQSINKISNALKGRKLSSRSRETRYKISSSMKTNGLSGGHRIGAGRGTKHTYRNTLLYTDMSLGVAKTLDYDNIIWNKPMQLFQYIDDNNKIKQTHLDFYLSQYDVYLSIKEFDDKNSRIRIKSIEKYNNIRIILIGSFLYQRIKYTSFIKILENMLKNRL